MKYKKTAFVLFIVAVLATVLRAEDSLVVIDSVRSAITSENDSLIRGILPQAINTDTAVSLRNDTLALEVISQPEPIDSDSGSSLSAESPGKDAVKLELKKKMVYLVCAARCSSRANAERHLESLKLFGYTPWIQVKDNNVFLVVLAKTDQRPKAEKMKSNYEKRGLLSFIEES
jgi:hypothetical protein